MADTSSLQRYDGDEKLVVAIDLGSTQSAVSIAHLTPGLYPVVKIVNRWPGQEEAAGDSKVPSLIGYDNTRAIAFGTDALDCDPDEVELARWFKLHLNPNSIKSAASALELPALPKGVILKQIYADYLKYLFEHAQRHFTNTTVDGQLIWSRLNPTLHLILATPNSYEVGQQSFLQSAVVLAGILPPGGVEDRLSFVTESEASLHYALQYSQGQTWLEPGTVFIVCDAGGSTVDCSVYRCTNTSPKVVLEEIQASECVPAGSVFVDRAARVVIAEKLEGSAFSQRDYLDEILSDFEKKTKRKFDGTQASSVIKFGNDRDNDRAVGIVRGRLTLSKQEVERTFEGCVSGIVQTCRRLMEQNNVQYLLLVGGFGESLYLRKRLRESFDAVQVVTLDEPTKKAAAEGAALWYVKQLVQARAARTTLGVIVNKFYDPTVAEHLQRRDDVVLDPNGRKKLIGLFDTCVSKHEVVKEDTKKVFPYYRRYESVEAAKLDRFTLTIHAYDGEGHCFYGWDSNKKPMPNVRRVCTLTADMSKMHPEEAVGSDGKPYWRVDHALEIFFGGTTLKARLSWKEGSRTEEGPVAIIPTTVY